MWDPAVEIEGSKEEEERDQILLPCLWNKNGMRLGEWMLMSLWRM